MNLGLALSGGGTRAATFHLGVLLRLAQEQLLEIVVRLSTVSGGSLVTALILTRDKIAWPSSSEFVESVYPSLRDLLTTTDLFSFKSLVNEPRQIPLLPFQRAQVLVNLLQSRWGVHGTLSELPDCPAWSINTTCIETGKNWRFSKHEMGDWIFGRHYNPTFAINQAAAASAAVPYVIGALKLLLPSEGWYDTNPATSEPVRRKSVVTKSVRLWDGGAYENLGIEPLYKPGRNMIGCDHIIVSDASGKLSTIGEKRKKPDILSGNLSTPRLFDVSSDQIRALRSRIFVDALRAGTAKGALIRMGNSVRDIDISRRALGETNSYRVYQTDEDVTRAFFYPTNLTALTESDFDIIARHGFECADATLNAYCSTLVSKHIPWGN